MAIKFAFGIEIEVVVVPLMIPPGRGGDEDDYKNYYRSWYASCLKISGLQAIADPLDEPYRKHPALQ